VTVDGMPTSTGSPATSSGYAAVPGCYDEAVDAAGAVRPPYADLMRDLRGSDLEALRRDVAEDLRDQGVTFGSNPGGFTVDPVPRVLTAAEWDHVKSGVAQRIRALNHFVTDAYGDRKIVAAGVVPPRVIDGASYFEPALRGHRSPHDTWTHVAGLDLIRDAYGEFMVLEDNCRTPSGLAYAMAARAAVGASLPAGLPESVRGLDGAWEHLGAALRAAAPEGVTEPVIVLLCDGDANVAYFEHMRIAATLGIPLVTLGDLRLRGDRLIAEVGGATLEVDVVYRRTNQDRFHQGGGPTDIAAALGGPLLAGTLAVANAFGTGVADDKLTHAYVEDMVRFYLREEPLLPSVPTYDLGDARVRERALARVSELVVKPRDGYGGEGIVVCPHATAEDIAAVAERVRANPESWIAQEMVVFSTHPTAIGSALAPRHVDLRPFAYIAGEEIRVVPGGLSRVALGEGALVVNSSQQGGAKDTWILDA
jgi:uncharacterized circularly permuted ATP-grasp superfamily protein